MMSLNTGWLQPSSDQRININGGTILIKGEEQSLSQAIVLKPEDQQVYLQTTDASGQQRGLIKLQSAVLTSSKNSIFTQTEPTNRFTQTDNIVSGTLVSRGQEGTTIAMFEPTVQPQVYIATPIEQKKDGDPVCYNVNMIQKVPLHTTTGAAVGTAVMDDKGCYRLDMTTPFSYNYVMNPNTTLLSAAPAQTTYKCDLCGLTFSHLTLLTHHKRVHTQQQQQQQQSHHIQVQCEEMDDKTHKCDICGQIFNLPGELKSHKNALHKEYQMTMTTTPRVTHTRVCDICAQEVTVYQVQGLKKKRFRCPTCAQPPVIQAVNPNIVPDAGDEVTIKAGHHPVKKRGVPCVTKCQACNGSGIIFVGGSKVKPPPPADRTFQCQICDGVFSRYSSLWSHKRLHTGDKPFKCNTCGLAFAKAAYLKNHYRVHTGEKPFSCSTCGMQFSQSPHLKNHERIHSGERPYQCEVCHKNFARHSTLWNHRRIHTGEKPYKCNVCDAKFNQATHLKNHAKVHTGEKPYKCGLCEVAFADRFALKRHTAVHEKYAKLAQTSQAHVDDGTDDDEKKLVVTFAQA